jgi:hypothetical protein
MKIIQLLSGFDIALNNQEHQFVEKYNHVRISSLTEHDKWMAQNLVRRGIYTISKDNETLVKNIDEKY